MTVVVIQGDAGDTSTWKDCVPVDLLVLCGIFGNISPGDIEQTISCVPAMVRDGGYVVWTRGEVQSRTFRPKWARWPSIRRTPRTRDRDREAGMGDPVPPPVA